MNISLWHKLTVINSQNYNSQGTIVSPKRCCKVQNTNPLIIYAWPNIKSLQLRSLASSIDNPIFPIS